MDKDALITESSSKFLWILRDFMNERVHPQTGKETSSKDYLDYCLRNKVKILIKNEFQDKNSSEALIRDYLIKYFPDRDCAFVTKPADDEEDYSRLTTSYDFGVAFQKDIEEVKKKVFKETNSKRIKGKKLNGFSLSNLLLELVEAINKNSPMNLNAMYRSLLSQLGHNHQQRH